MVRKGGLEPPHLSVPDPKSGASANSATFANFSNEKEYHVVDAFVIEGRQQTADSRRCGLPLLTTDFTDLHHAVGDFLVPEKVLTSLFVD